MLETNVALPSKPRIISEDEFSGVYEIDGLYPGYGHTLGNSLRRIILSSLPGAAITQVKTFATTVINENKNFIGMKDSTLVSALEKITTAEMDLVNSIKITRNSLSSPKNLDQQITILTV